MKKRHGVETPDPYPYRRKIVAQWLSRAPLYTFTYTTDIAPDDLNLHVTNGQHNSLSTVIKTREDAKIAEVDSFGVHPDMQRQGIGQRMLKGMLCLTFAGGASELWSDNVSSFALGARVKVLGAEAMRFYDTEPDEPAELDISFDDAFAITQRLDGLLPDDAIPQHLRQICCLGVKVDLTSLDVDPWLPEFDKMIIEDLGQMGSDNY